METREEIEKALRTILPKEDQEMATQLALIIHQSLSTLRSDQIGTDSGDLALSPEMQRAFEELRGQQITTSSSIISFDQSQAGDVNIQDIIYGTKTTININVLYPPIQTTINTENTEAANKSTEEFNSREEKASSLMVRSDELIGALFSAYIFSSAIVGSMIAIPTGIMIALFGLIYLWPDERSGIMGFLLWPFISFFTMLVFTFVLYLVGIIRLRPWHTSNFRRITAKNQELSFTGVRGIRTIGNTVLGASVGFAYGAVIAIVGQAFLEECVISNNYPSSETNIIGTFNAIQQCSIASVQSILSISDFSWFIICCISAGTIWGMMGGTEGAEKDGLNGIEALSKSVIAGSYFASCIAIFIGIWHLLSTGLVSSFSHAQYGLLAGILGAMLGALNGYGESGIKGMLFFSLKGALFTALGGLFIVHTINSYQAEGDVAFYITLAGICIGLIFGPIAYSLGWRD